MFIHFFCLCPLSLTIKLNFNISKVAYLNELSVQYQECVDKVKGSFQAYQREGSGWQLQEVSS